jgi:hypothetical protein
MSAANKELFERWFVKPVEVLKERLPDNDGGFLALAAGIFLYERLWLALKKASLPVAASVVDQLAIDFNLGPSGAKDFWEMARNGLFHFGMLKQKDRKRPNLPLYQMGEDFPALEHVLTTTQQCFRFDPFKFTAKVFKLWEPHIDILDINKDCPIPFVLMTGEHPHTQSNAPTVGPVAPAHPPADD